MDEIASVLDSKERVLWRGSPQFAPYFARVAVPLGAMALVFMAFLAFFATAFLAVSAGFAFVGAMAGAPAAFLGIPLLFGLPVLFLIGAFFIVLILPIAYAYLSHRHTFYAITDRRVILQSGVIGRDFCTIDFDQISNAEVNVDLFDKLFGKGSGTILIRTAGDPVVYAKQHAYNKPSSLSSISFPYEAFKFFKKVSFDVKTDMEYPNKYRPKSNPGYKTSYSSKNKR